MVRRLFKQEYPREVLQVGDTCIWWVAFKHVKTSLVTFFYMWRKKSGDTRIDNKPRFCVAPRPPTPMRKCNTRRTKISSWLSVGCMTSTKDLRIPCGIRWTPEALSWLTKFCELACFLNKGDRMRSDVEKSGQNL